MENACNLFNNSGRGQNGNCTNVAWDVWDHHWSSTSTNTNAQNSFHHHNSASISASTAAAVTSTSAGNPEESAFHALLFSQHGSGSNHHCSSPYAGIGTHYHPDPHLMCLKLGKRNYFEDATVPSVRHVAGFSISKRGKPYYGGGGGGGGMRVPSATAAVTVAIPATVPRCQVEGCHVALLNTKDYHRRHKVCELHSKAPRVVVLGLEQRFCQQCSRFHVVTEFDDSKRSCRRRLAGHNERRRKSSHEHSVSRNNPSQGRFAYLSSSSSSPTGSALSLLSSRNESLISSSPDLSSRCSAALRELIAENRAALLARQLIIDKDWPFHHLNDQTHHFGSNLQHHMFPEPHGWDRFNGTTGTNNVTLDLMQAPTSAFELLSMRGKSSSKEEEEEEEECSRLWSSFGGSAHVI